MFEQGKFDYNVPRPIVPGLSRHVGHVLDTPTALRLQQNFGLLARGLNKKTVTYWGVGKVGTDHSYQDKHGRHIIVADPRRLSQPDRMTPSSVGLPRLTNANVSSVTGAVIHEVAHTLYTPKIAKLSPKELAVFRVYEDAYINAYILNQRLPGATPLLQHAFNWSNPRPQLVKSVAAAVKQWEDQPTFKAAVSVLGNADFIARITNRNDTVRVPNAELVALLNKVQPVSDKLTAGELIEWDDRLKLYRKIAKVIDACIPAAPAQQQQPQDAEPSTPDEAQGEDGQPGGEGEYADADPDQDDASDKWDDDGNELDDGKDDGTASDETGDGEDIDDEGEGDFDYSGDIDDTSAETEGSQSEGSSKGAQPTPAPAETEAEDEGLDETYGDDAKDVDLTCEEIHQEHGQTGSDSLMEALERANHATLATEEDGVVLADGTYTKAQPGRYVVKGIDAKRIEALAKVFKAKSSVRRAVVHGVDEGRISGRRLGKLISGTSKNVFKARPVFKQESAAVLLLVDGSGSMQGANYDGAALAAYELFSALQGNSDYAIYGWVYGGSGTLDIEGCNLEGKTLAWPVCNGGSTPSHQAMVEAAKFLKKQHGNGTRLIVHFSDLGYTDRPTPEFNALEHERGLQYATVSIVEHPDHFAQALSHSQRVSPLMRVSGYTSQHLVQAVQELVARTF